MLPHNSTPPGLKTGTSQKWYNKSVKIPGIGHIRNATDKVNNRLKKHFWAVFFISGFLCICHNESGWKTIVVTDVTKAHILKLHSFFSYLPVSLSVYAVGDLEGGFYLENGIYPDVIPLRDRIEAKGWFYQSIYQGDWYNKCYVRYAPMDIRTRKDGRKGAILIHYKYEDFCDVLVEVTTIFITPNRGNTAR